MTTPLQLLDTDTGQLVDRRPKRTGATKALNELFYADWPNLPTATEGLKILAELGIGCTTATFYVARTKYINRMNASTTVPPATPLSPESPPESPPMSLPMPASPPAPPPRMELKSDSPALPKPPTGSMETLIRVCGWVEQIGGIDKMRNWIDFVEDFQQRFPR